MTLFASPSLASDGVYLTGSIGASKAGDLDVEGTSSNVEFDSGMNLEVGLGYDLGKTRIEASWERSQSDEYSWLGLSWDTDTTVDSLLGSIIYEFGDNYSRLTPFVGASLGTSSVEFDGETASSLSYGIQGGLSFKTSQNTEIFAKVNRLVINDLDFGDGLEVKDANTTGIRLGTRFNF